MATRPASCNDETSQLGYTQQRPHATAAPPAAYARTTPATIDGDDPGFWIVADRGHDLLLLRRLVKPKEK